MADHVVRGKGDGALLEHVLSFSKHVKDLHFAMMVSHAWHEAALSNAVWCFMCEQLWAGKKYVPSHFRDPSEMSRHEAYFRSIADSTRTVIKAEELCAITWHHRMKRCSGAEWTSRDPWWQCKTARKYTYQQSRPGSGRYDSPADEGLVVRERTGSWRMLPPKGGASRIQLIPSHTDDPFPTYYASRHKWGWIIQNCWHLQASFPLPAQDDLLAQEVDPELYDTSRFELGVNQALQWNLGYPLDDDEAFEDIEAMRMHEERVPSPAARAAGAPPPPPLAEPADDAGAGGDAGGDDAGATDTIRRVEQSRPPAHGISHEDSTVPSKAAGDAQLRQLPPLNPWLMVERFDRAERELQRFLAAMGGGEGGGGGAGEGG